MTEKQNLPKSNYRAGFLGLIGQPNAGKSTLMNKLVSEKVSIVTSKPQTTRRRIMGIYNDPNGQIVFVDAPGIIKATSGLNHFLQKEAEDVIKNSDALLAVLSVDEESVEANQEIIDLVKKSRKPWLALINKSDLSDKVHRVSILKEMIKQNGGESLSWSDKTMVNEDKEILISKCISLLPESPAPLFEVDMYTTESVKALCEEVVREKCFQVLTHEIPYQIAVRTRQFDEEAKPCPKIYMDILVNKESQKPILIGKGAANIKKIGELSRAEIQKIMNVDKVFLDLKVVVAENWFEKPKTMKDLKYVIKEE